MNNNKNGELLQRIATYSAVAGASIAGSGPALADPVSVNPGIFGTYTARDGCRTVGLDVDRDSNDDFNLRICDEPGSSFIAINHIYDNVYGNRGEVAGDYNCRGENYQLPYGAVNVAPGTAISSSTGGAWWYSGKPLWREPPSCSHFPEGEQGIVAFRLCRPGYCGDPDTRYGYLNVRWDRGSTILNILGGEHETTAGAPITARAYTPPPAPVPVGGAVPLGIGLLALGAAALRRRRKHGDH